MNISKSNEFSSLVNETLKGCDDNCDLKCSDVLILDGKVDQKTLVFSKPHFVLQIKDILLNSMYVPMERAEAVIFNKSLCRAFSRAAGIPEMYIGCYFIDDNCKIFFSKSEGKLLEAIDIASSYDLAG